jgi:hypothetical protein
MSDDLFKENVRREAVEVAFGKVIEEVIEDAVREWVKEMGDKGIRDKVREILKDIVTRA